eukprot:scaffold13289_cov59-Phaeocystis_antarctica.AAC.2
MQAEFHGGRGLRELSVSTTGATTTLAGSGSGGIGWHGGAFKDDVVGTNAQFKYPSGIAIALSGDFVLVTVRAWPPAPRASWPSPAPAAAHPPRTHRVLAPDASQGVHNHRIRRVDISTGATTTLAGSGVKGFKDDDVGTNAQFSYPFSVAIAPNGVFALVAARTAALQGVVPAATHRAAGSLLAQRVLAPDASQDHGNHRIRRVDISTGATTTLAGSGVAGFNDDDVGTNAQFKDPIGVAIAPNGDFVLVTVRAWPPASRASWPPPSPRSGTPASHTRPTRPQALTTAF